MNRLTLWQFIVREAADVARVACIFAALPLLVAVGLIVATLAQINPRDETEDDA